MIKKEVRIRIKTMKDFENLPFIIADIPECLLSCLLIRDSSVVSSSTGLNGKVSGGRCKGGQNKLTVDKIKNLLTDFGSPTKDLLTIKIILKNPMYTNKVIKLISLTKNKTRLQ